jgi:N-acetylneuraminate lyase
MLYSPRLYIRKSKSPNNIQVSTEDVMKITFSGAWPALMTPFTDKGEVNVSVLKELVDYLIEKRIGGLYVCGTTGEGIYMSLDERRLVAETVIDHVGGRIPVITHIGCVSVNDAVELAKHSEQSGAQGISSILPPLYKNTESLYAYYSAISDAIRDTPILTYIFGGPVDAVKLMDNLMRIPNVAGVKYTGPNMYEFRHIVELRDRNWTVFSGMDEQCLFAAMFGSSGNIGSTLNFMPGVYREIHDCVKNDDLIRGRELQLRANRVTRTIISFGFPGALRKVMGILGFDCGNPRLPNLPFPDEKLEDLKAHLETSGFSELANM